LVPPLVNGSIHTHRAKKGDIEKFLKYFVSIVNDTNIQLWNPAISRGFQRILLEQVSETGNNYTATTINRVLASIRHFGNWLVKEHKILTTNPCLGVKQIITEEPAWNGLTNLQIDTLKKACEYRINNCTKINQTPLLEYVVFSILLTTGLRETELTKLNFNQYFNNAFNNVKRKGNKVTKHVPIITETKELLDKYLNTRINILPSSPLITSRYNTRLQSRDIARACERVAKEANIQYSNVERIKLSPHMLRHTFLKRIADKHGVHIAQELSGNISIKEIFRYTKPNYSHKHEIVEKLF
jgi:integrase/recombinase XerD